jgi:hypothetical protein
MSGWEGLGTMTNLHKGNSRCTCLDPYCLHYEETRQLGHLPWCPLMSPDPKPEAASLLEPKSAVSV